MSAKPTPEQIEVAYSQAVEAYIAKRREKVGPFVDKYFGWQGSAQRHKEAFGWDMLKAPANLIWAIPFLLVKLTGKGLGLVGWKSAGKTLENIWPGFTTDVQRESERLIYEELLELPWQEGEKENQKNALFEEIFNRPEISSWVDAALGEIEKKSQSEAYKQRLEKNLQQFASAQVSAADIATNLLVLAGTYVSAKQYASSALGAGSVIASALAQQMAISSFWAGSTLGSFWYGWFPAQASLGIAAVSVAGVAIVLAVLASFAGILTDPIQTKFGLHQKRMHKALDDLEADLNGQGSVGYTTKAPIVARILDMVDMLYRAVAA